MVEYHSAQRNYLEDIVEDHEGEITLVGLEEDGTMDQQRIIELQSVVNFGQSGLERNKVVTHAKHEDGDLQTMKLDLEALWNLIYEHQQFVEAKDFSETQVSVLRAIDENHNERVHVDEIKDSQYTEGLSDSSIYNALRSLREKELVKSLKGKGYYKYSGPSL